MANGNGRWRSTPHFSAPPDDLSSGRPEPSADAMAAPLISTLSDDVGIASACPALCRRASASDASVVKSPLRLNAALLHRAPGLEPTVRCLSQCRPRPADQCWSRQRNGCWRDPMCERAEVGEEGEGENTVDGKMTRPPPPSPARLGACFCSVSSAS